MRFRKVKVGGGGLSLQIMALDFKRKPHNQRLSDDKISEAFFCLISVGERKSHYKRFLNGEGAHSSLSMMTNF